VWITDGDDPFPGWGNGGDDPIDCEDEIVGGWWWWFKYPQPE